MKCRPKQLDSGYWHCKRCGYTSKKILDQAFVKECIPGLGDRTEKVLSFFGITKDKVSYYLKYFNPLQSNNSQGCGCEKRQELLNDLGDKIGL